jgi:hypothetical protein
LYGFPALKAQERQNEKVFLEKILNRIYETKMQGVAGAWRKNVKVP